MKSNHVVFLSATIATLLLSGCMATNASKTTGSDYRTAETRKAGEVQYGSLVNIRTVMIRENEGTEARNAATMGSGGALLGGYAGGNSNGLGGAIIGGLIGSIAGSITANKLGEVEGYEMDVQLSDNKVIVVVQAKKENESFTAGMKVRVVKYGETYRVSALNG